jgi:hypothetical protein
LPPSIGAPQLQGAQQNNVEGGDDGGDDGGSSDPDDGSSGGSSGSTNIYGTSLDWWEAEWPWWEAIKAGTGSFFSNLWNGIKAIPGAVKSIFSGEAGRALGDRGVAIAENMGDGEFNGELDDWLNFSRAVAGDLAGTNQIAEGIGGADLATEELLSTEERIKRAAIGTATLAGNLAGGISAVGRVAPKTFPSAAASAAKTAERAARLTAPIRNATSNVANAIAKRLPQSVQTAATKTMQFLDDLNHFRKNDRNRLHCFPAGTLIAVSDSRSPR